MANLLKELYNKEFIITLAKDIHHIYPKFNQNYFIQKVFDNDWTNKELKQRMRHIAISIHSILNLNYIDAITILQKCFIYRQKDISSRVYQ